MYKFEVIDNKEQWSNILSSFKDIDCYYSFEYGELFANIENGEIFAAYFVMEDTKIFYPFIKRKVPIAEDKAYDIVTPYGYGGPIIIGKNEGPVDKFFEVFSKYCNSKNIITETIRFHPLYKNHQLCMGYLDIEYIRKTTAVDLTQSLVTIRKKYSSSNKRNINKAVKNNLTCFGADNSLDNIKLFMDLYNETMDRNNAANYYYFTENYFLKQVKKTDICNTYLLFTELNNEIIAGVMVFIGEGFAHYHLGASKTTFLDLKPNNLLFDFMIEFCKSKGANTLHLGGGYQEGDGLFRFKSSFTNQNNYEYYIGKKVHDFNKYHEIINNLSKHFIINDEYFPMYRGQMQRKYIHRVEKRGEMGEAREKDFFISSTFER
ncbi:lipid II:glycine glycyltransferase FemX [Neobacillus drentensis]|uniref:lipid II:glycine glycyltransferase FemX n=1 Tax=Neobacillus drentensis TaxID=220684 RepID=UPI0028570BA7|nr:GNAT family N-acetyltransferase [Neobacillus drentensis]MDR7239980.1 hypothetical protein [Neobacillus drentensis]